jgi:hypothetical protein
MLKTLTAMAVILIIGINPAKAETILIQSPENQSILQTTIPNARAQRKLANPVKLTVRNFPLHRIFADDDDDSFGVAQPIMHYRKEIELAVVTESAEDVTISDSVALRLWLIRELALKKHQECWT